jgi:hypothetical protein
LHRRHSRIQPLESLDCNCMGARRGVRFGDTAIGRGMMICGRGSEVDRFNCIAAKRERDTAIKDLLTAQQLGTS